MITLIISCVVHISNPFLNSIRNESNVSYSMSNGFMSAVSMTFTCLANTKTHNDTTFSLVCCAENYSNKMKVYNDNFTVLIEKNCKWERRRVAIALSLKTHVQPVHTLK